MKKIIFRLGLLLLFVLAFFTHESEAQNREFGLRMSNLSEFGMIYKKDKGDYWTRLHATVARIDVNPMFNQSSIRIGISTGREKRKEMANSLNFIHGYQFFFNSQFFTSDSDFNNSLAIGFGYVIGMTYTFQKGFNLSLETIPRLSLGFNVANSELTSFVLGAGFDSEVAALVITKTF